jgi:hypothetical protein
MSESPAQEALTVENYADFSLIWEAWQSGEPMLLTQVPDALNRLQTAMELVAQQLEQAEEELKRQNKWRIEENQRAEQAERRAKMEQEIAEAKEFEVHQAEQRIEELETRHHSLRWTLGLETHAGETPQPRVDAHRNLDALLDAREDSDEG